MEYSTEITKVSPAHGRLQVIYRSEGKPDLVKNIPLASFDTATIESVVESHAAWAANYWDRMEAAVPVDEVAVGVGVPKSRTYVRPEPVVPQPPTPEEILEERLNAISADRWSKEVEGVIWSDAQGDTFIFDSSPQSQTKFASAELAMTKGIRGEGGSWKCGAVDELGNLTVAFKSLTHAELSQIVDAVYLHVQKCFEAEKIASEKLLAGDNSADFATEFAAL